MDAKKKRQIQAALKKLAESHASSMVFLEETLSFICAELDLDRIAPLPGSSASEQIRAKSNQRLLDRQLLSVVYAGKRCFLGNTLPFKLLERLARCPNQYVSNEQLLDDVWDRLVTRMAIRSVVKVLRSRLREAGLGRVADAIDGHVTGHYALMLNQL
jgi:DNA-binding response OmpR family regulator